jgi:hypothetical protein
MSKKKEFTLVFVIPFLIAILSMIFALWILPKNCSLFISNSPGPQMCHTIEFTKDGKFIPSNCHEGYCQDLRLETAATFIFSFGVLLFFLPAVLYIYREFHGEQAEKIKLFD